MIELAHKVQIRLRSCRSGKYLRCNKQGGVDARAGRSPDSVFMVHRIDANTLKLQSCENPNQWIQVLEDGTVNDLGKGGKSCHLVLKFDEREQFTMSPAFNIDWHVGTDQFGNILSAADIPHDATALFTVELVSAQILRDTKLNGGK